MCMLTTVVSPSDKFSREFLVLLLMLNSAANKDGTGIWSAKTSWKTELAAIGTINLGEIAQHVLNDAKSKIYMGHVRAASTGIPVTLENAHPFVSEMVGITLAHNGKLIPKEKPSWLAIADIYKTSDSFVFLRELENKIKSQGKNRDIIVAMQETMKIFTGKFAFLIYDDIENNFYAVRGKSAKLYLAYILDAKNKKIGYIINTCEDKLMLASLIMRNLKESVGSPMYKIADPKLLSDNKIFKLSVRNISEVAGIIENTATAITSNYSGYAGYRGNHTSMAKPIKDTSSAILSVLKFQDEYNLSPADIDRLFQTTLAKTLSSVTENDVKDFVEFVIVRLTQSKKIRKWIKNKFITGVPIAMYTVHGLEWPWMVNSLGEIKEAATKHANAQKKRQIAIKQQATKGV